MKLLAWTKHAAEYLGGSRDNPPTGLPLPLRSLAWGVLWTVLAGVILLFCGQSSKFIYIDF